MGFFDAGGSAIVDEVSREFDTNTRIKDTMNDEKANQAIGMSALVTASLKSERSIMSTSPMTQCPSRTYPSDAAGKLT